MSSIDYQEARKEIIKMFADDGERKVVFWYDPAKNFMDDITAAETKTVDGEEVEEIVLLGTRVNNLNEGEIYNWHIDDAASYEAKKDQFFSILYGIVGPIELILNFLLRGESIRISEG